MIANKLKRTRKKLRRALLFLLFVILVCLLYSTYLSGGNSGKTAESEISAVDSTTASAGNDLQLEELEPYYQQVWKDWSAKGYKQGTSELRIQAKDYNAKSDNAQVTVGSYKERNDVLIWANDSGTVDYTLTVPESGLFELALDYYPFAEEDGGSVSPVILSASIDGKFTFREARSMLFDRQFHDQWPLKTDEAGNQIRPQTTEIAGWKHKAFRDSDGAYALPLQWYLTEGEHTLRIELLKEPVALEAITLKPAAAITEYKTVKASYPSQVKTSQQLIQIEAEQMSSKSDTSIQMEDVREPLLSPVSYNKILYNTVGGTRWFRGDKTITWAFDAPQDGLYKIALQSYQGTRKDLSVFRTLAIDGKIPFAELASYQFPSRSDWYGAVLADEEAVPYEFYLKKGQHELALSINFTPYMNLIVQIEQMSQEIRSVTAELRAVTGGKEDRYRIWDMDKEVPGITARLQKLREQLEDLSRKLVEINGARDEVSSSFQSGAEDIATLLKKPNEIPNKQLRIGLLQETLETQRTQLMEAPLSLDKIILTPVGQKFPRMSGNLFENIGSSLKKFMHSFENRNQISKQNKGELNVWMAWGRDYVEELQQLADEKFTPEFGIKVNINLMQDPKALVMANSAGLTPDLALGIPMNMPVDMALRNTALDLSQFPGSREVLEGYHPGALLPYYYKGGYYGLPETNNMKVLFYRKDILAKLGLKIPDTWEEVYELLPTLLQKNYNFYLEPNDYSYFLFQNGAELYSEDGLSSALNQPLAFRAFKQWTDMFNVYGLERQVQSFYNQFRNGYMPLGISDFNTYVQLLIAAPELRGIWGIAPIPGTLQADGSIARWSGGTALQTSSAMLFKSGSEEKQLQAWSFLQWYTSTEIQTEFGLNLEQSFGEQLRWTSGNVAAFANMPWKKADLSVILEQWKWIKNVPNVPGGYISPREINNSWIRSVVNGKDPRTSLEEGVKEINRELIRKQQEFHLLDGQGNAIESLKLPQVTEPWNGVQRYVE